MTDPAGSLHPDVPAPTVSAVVPVLAEEDTVAQVVHALQESLGAGLLEAIVVVSPRSPEATLRVCRGLEREAPGRVLVCEQQQWPGVGYAYREGIAGARGDFVLCIDSDGEMDTATVPALLHKQRETNADLVVASRWAAGGGLTGYDPVKYVLNWGYQRIFRLIFGTKLTDLTYGFKLVRSSLARRMPLRSRSQEIGCETTLFALRFGANAAEVPTVWRAREAGASTGAWRGNLRYVWTALRALRWRGPAADDPGRARLHRVDWPEALRRAEPRSS